MNYWWTSDYHFSHFNIIRYCKRPFETAEEMNETIIRKHNERVKPEDTVFFLGDRHIKSLCQLAHDFFLHVPYWKKRFIKNMFGNRPKEVALVLFATSIMPHRNVVCSMSLRKSIERAEFHIAIAHDVGIWCATGSIL